ncbi:hypothetical protein ACFYZB_23340 [Streptomyces sp. NPDC001852]|uniref:hypothetical protein n=1 Tax=Streptomyces sp. NPDC001852 TaxID=3364619 RepID=UPI00368E8AAE
MSAITTRALPPSVRILCGRKMQPATIRSRIVYHRCEFKEEEAALYPDLTHPRTVYLREDIVCRALDRSAASGPGQQGRADARGPSVWSCTHHASQGL